jgi:hypothetical protein
MTQGERSNHVACLMYQVTGLRCIQAQSRNGTLVSTGPQVQLLHLNCISHSFHSSAYLLRHMVQDFHSRAVLADKNHKLCAEKHTPECNRLRLQTAGDLRQPAI